MARACFTFDNLGEAAEIGEGRRSGVDPDGHPSIVRGLPAILDRLAAHEVRASFYVEGWNGLHHPGTVRTIADAGHEVGMHGWVHEPWSGLAPDDERETAARATAALRDALGSAPVGFRAPGGDRTPSTEQILLDLGYRHDASAGAGPTPTRLPGGLPNVPFVWPAVDGYWYLRPEPEDPAVVRDAWIETFDRVVSNPDGVFLVICHPFVTGIDAGRLAALDAVVERAVADPRVTVSTVGEVAAALP